MEAKPQLTVLDDEESIGFLIEEIASDMGYEVSTYTDVKAFKDELNNDTSILFLDLMMPDEDGIEVIRYLATRHLHTKVVLMSGFDKRVLKSASIMARNQGVDIAAELTKPIGLHQLRDAIHQCETAISSTKQEAMLLAAAEIETAIAEQRVVVHYQPKIDLQTGQVFGAEALVRIRDREQGLIYPDRFIGVAEEHGSIVELSREVLKQSIAFCAQLKGMGYDINVAINMSAQLLTDVMLTDELVSKINEAGIQPANITLEITESALVQNYALSLDVLARLRMKGVLLSIDDFGTGYSTMQQLKNVPFTELKLDRSFVMDIFDEDARVIINKSIELGHDLGLRVIAEGVENQAIADELKALGCDYCQGYHFSRPIMAEEFVQYLKSK